MKLLQEGFPKVGIMRFLALVPHAPFLWDWRALPLYSRVYFQDTVRNGARQHFTALKNWAGGHCEDAPRNAIEGPRRHDRLTGYR